MHGWRVLVCAVCIGLVGCASATRTARDVPADVPTLSVMSYNVNLGLGGDPDALRLIRDADADAVFLQETTPRWEAAIRAALASEYPHMTFLTSSGGGAGGMAMLSKSPFEARQDIPSPVQWFPALRIVLRSRLGPVQVLAVHLHPPVSEDGSFARGYLTTAPLREQEMLAFLEHLDPMLPTLVLGDFNEGDGGEAVSVLKDRGMSNVLRQYDPYQKTWHWRTSVATLSQTLDHIFCDARLEPVEARVIEAGNSDHYPLIASFVRAGALAGR